MPRFTYAEDARGNDVLGIEIAEIDDLAHLRNGAFCGRGHDRPEIARGLAVDEITPAIAAQCLDEGEVGTNREFEHVVPAFDAPRLLAFGERRAVTGRRIERADPGTCGVDALGQVALRYQLELELARSIQPVEHPRVGLAGKRADDLLHPPRLEQRRQPCLAVARVVADDRQVASPLRDQRIDQLGGHPGSAEAADHHRRAIADVGDRFGGGGDNLVDHGILRRSATSLTRLRDYRTNVRSTDSLRTTA